MSGEPIDLGDGVTFRWVGCSHGQQTNGIVRFEPEHVEGLISFCAACPGETWDLVSRDPLTISPSVDASVAGGRHGHIRGGRWC